MLRVLAFGGSLSLHKCAKFWTPFTCSAAKIVAWPGLVWSGLACRPEARTAPGLVFRSINFHIDRPVAASAAAATALPLYVCLYVFNSITAPTVTGVVRKIFTQLSATLFAPYFEPLLPRSCYPWPCTLKCSEIVVKHFAKDER